MAGWWVAGAQCPVTAVLLVLAASSTLLTCSRSALTPRPGPPAPAAFSACPPPAPHTRVFAALAARTRTGVHTKYFLPLHFFTRNISPSSSATFWLCQLPCWRVHTGINIKAAECLPWRSPGLRCGPGATSSQQQLPGRAAPQCGHPRPGPGLGTMSRPQCPRSSI